MTQDWFAMPSEPFYRDTPTEIRIWEAGDGLMCTARKSNKTPCGRPVAVQRSMHAASGAMPASTRTRVICAHHLAELVTHRTRDKFHGASIKTAADKVAREAVIANHWDEYQEAYKNAVDEAQNSALSLLPETLREVARQSIETDEAPDGQ